MWKTLKSLDDLKLIRLHQGTRVELVYGSLLTVTTQQSPMSRITQKLGVRFLERLENSHRSPLSGIEMSLLKLSRESAESLRQDLDRIYRTQLRQSEIDSAFLPESELKTCSLMVAAGEFSFL